LVSGREIPCKSGKSGEIGGNPANFMKTPAQCCRNFKALRDEFPGMSIREFLRASREVTGSHFRGTGKLVVPTGSIRFGLTKVNDRADVLLVKYFLLSFPKIISARSGDAIRTRLARLAPDRWTARRSGASFPNPKCVRVSL